MALQDNGLPPVLHADSLQDRALHRTVHMFRVRLLGTPHVDSSRGAIPQGPRRVAMLAALAASGPGGLTRDKLVTLLWPDGDADRSRRNLSQLLYAMRTELGAELVEGTGTLRLDTTQCEADVLTFDAAIAEKRWADALAAYGGPFLDGFHLAESAEFSQWVDVERDRRSAQARTAAVRVAEAVAADDPGTRATAWRRALALDPLSASLTLRLMEALAAHGDRAGAIRIAEQHATLLKSELEAAPDAAVSKRAEELRRTPAEARGVAPSPNAPVTVAAPASAAVADGAADRPVDGVADRVADPSPGRGSGGMRRRVLLAAGALLLAAGAVAWTLRSPARLDAEDYVLIARFENRTADTLLTHTLAAAVAAAMQQSAFVVPLPRSRVSAAMRRMQRVDSTEFLPLDIAREVAERESVRFVIAGELVAVGTARELITRILEPATGRIVAAHTFSVPSDSLLLDAIDRAARTLRRDLGEARSSVNASRPLPDVTTASLGALHEYALALDAERRNHSLAYRTFLQRAVALDPDFAAAHAKLAESFALNNDVPSSTRHGDRALALAEQLPLPEALRIRMSVAWSRGDRESTVSLARTYLAVRPRDFIAWTRLAFSLFSAGQHVEARQAYATADRLTPLSNGSVLNWGSSWLSAARRGRSVAEFDSARAYYERAFRGDSTLEFDTFFNHQYGTILLGVGLPDSARATYQRMHTRSDLDRARALRSLAYLDAYLGEWATVADRFAEAADIGTRQQQWTTAIRNEALVGESFVALGDRARAARPLARATTIALREPIEARMIAFIALAQVRAADLADARQLRDRMRALARPEHDAEQAALAFVDGAIELAAGNGVRAQEIIEGGFRRDSTNLQGRILRARALEASGSDSAALLAWDAVASVFEFGGEGQFEWQFVDAERARLLERLGRPDEASTALRRLVARYPSRANAIEPVVLSEARARLRRLETRRPGS